MEAKRILYVEDNPQNKRLVNKVLSAKGYIVLEAGDGPNGIEVALRERPDLILMDINIPGMDGMEATAVLKKSQIGNTPIIALTANAMRGDRERIMAAGCDEYLQKPLSNKLLVATVERFIGYADATPASAEPALQLAPDIIDTKPSGTISPFLELGVPAVESNAVFSIGFVQPDSQQERATP